MATDDDVALADDDVALKAALRATKRLVGEVVSAAAERLFGEDPHARYGVIPGGLKSDPLLGPVRGIAPSAEFAREELGWTGDAWHKAANYLWAVDGEPWVDLKNAANEPIASQPTLRLVDVQGAPDGRFVLEEDAKGLANGSLVYDRAVRDRALDVVLNCIEAYWRSLPKGA